MKGIFPKKKTKKKSIISIFNNSKTIDHLKEEEKNDCHFKT